jgi:DNA-binding winged helix-turn-helix (wHTH) protein
VPALTYRFGPFVLDRREYRLRRDALVVELPPKALDLLLHLLDRPGVLFTKEELFQTIWPDVAVTDNALNQVISEIRHALGDSAATPTYLQTVARRGYRFIGAVEAMAAEAAGEPATIAAADTAAARPDKPALAVVDFANVTGDPALAWLSAGIAETVLGDLSALGFFRIVDRERLRVAPSPHAGQLAIAAEVGANLTVTGSFQRSGDRLRIAARLVDTRTGEVRAEAKADGRLEDLFQLQDAIGRQLAVGIGAARAPGDEPCATDVESGCLPRGRRRTPSPRVARR